ncbi:MAG: nitroreductase family protein [Elusimicrobiota bacterium]
MNADDRGRRRRSIRAFQARPVEPEAVREILQAANSAPSAGNLQAYEVVCVSDPGRRRALAQASLGQHFVAYAPVALVFFANPRRCGGYGRRGEELYCVQDATIACAYAQLAAADLGLGSVWVGAFNDRDVSAAARAPARLRPVAILPIGYPAESPSPTPRRDLADLVRDEVFE